MKETWLIEGTLEGKRHSVTFSGTQKEFLAYFDTLLTLFPSNTYIIRKMA